MNDVIETMDRFYTLIVNAGAVEEFIAMTRLMAEIVTRNIGTTPVENRDMAWAKILNFYELADGAKSALDASETKAKVEEADRIRRELSGTPDE